jgi:hypothetical protein
MKGKVGFAVFQHLIDMALLPRLVVFEKAF